MCYKDMENKKQTDIEIKVLISVLAVIALVVVVGVVMGARPTDSISSYLSLAEKAAKKIEKEKNMYTAIAFVVSVAFFGILIAILVFVKNIYGVLDKIRIGLESFSKPTLSLDKKLQDCSAENENQTIKK